MLPCLECECYFQDSSNLRRHLRTVHGEEKPHVCNICHERFGRSDHLKRHIQRHENKSEHFVCGIGGCRRIFSTETKLEDHRNLHKKKLEENVLYIKGHLVKKLYAGNTLTFTCPLTGCDRRYESYSGISKHIARHSVTASENIASTQKTGTKVKQTIQCESCHREFKRKASFLEHRFRVHEKGADATNATELGCVGFVCPYEGCSRIFSRRSNVQAHVNMVHKGQNVFACDCCSATFSMERLLLQHNCSEINPEQQMDSLSFQRHQPDG